MILKCSLHNEAEMKEWDSFVTKHPQGTPFHLHFWLKTIFQSYKMEPHLYTIRNKQNTITSIFPLFAVKTPFIGCRLISIPFSDNCGPLCSNAYEENDLLKQIIADFGSHVNYIEIRSPLVSNDYYISENFFKRHILEINSDSCTLLENTDKKTIQYSIRKAQKAGVEIREENSLWGISEFFRLNKLTRKKHGVPHQPWRYFENLFQNMFASGNAFLLLAFYDSRVIAGGLFLKLNRTIYYKYNASDQNWLTEKRPNHLLTWHAIEKACREKYDFLDFGRTAACNDGLMRYKEMWGAKAVDLPYYFFPKATGFNSEKCGQSIFLENLKKVWQKLPDSLIDVVSSRVFKHLA